MTKSKESIEKHTIVKELIFDDGEQMPKEIGKNIEKASADIGILK